MGVILNPRQQRVIELLQNRSPLGAVDMLGELGSVPRSTLNRDLQELVHQGMIKPLGEASARVYELVPEEERKNILERLVETKVDSGGGDDEPLVDVKVHDPITPFRKWLKKLLDNEGFEFSFKIRIRPLTTIAVAVAILGTGMSVNKIWDTVRATPVINRLPLPRATPVAEVWTETAMVGKVEWFESDRSYYLLREDSSEMVKIEAGAGVRLWEFTGQRVLVRGTVKTKADVINVEEMKVADE